MIIFVRHGQTNDNLRHIVSGRRNVPLNKVGKTQANECAQILMWDKIDVVYCSPLKRAKQTARRIMRYHKHIPIIYDERLLEHDDGMATGMLDSEAFPDFVWDFTKEYTFVDFEPFSQMFERISSFYDEILKKHKGKTVLVVAHDGVGKMSRMYFEGMPESKKLDGFLFDRARPYFWADTDEVEQEIK